MARNRTLTLVVALFPIFAAISMLFTNCAGQGFSTIDSTAADGGDPFIDMAWHLHNTGQIVYASKAGTAGADMNLLGTWGQSIYGSGVKIMISDTGLEDTHEDLHDNFSYGGSKDYTLSYPYTANSSPPKATDDNHGTSVAGLAAAVGWNGLGSRGVAPKASLMAGNLISSQVTISSYGMIADQLAGSFDISNMSWGSTQNQVDDDGDGHNSNYEATMKSLLGTQRGGKGSIYVKAGGNDYIVECYGLTNVYCVGNSNFDRDNANPYQIIVAALDATGTSADYSSPGANLWISSFGGSYGDDSPAMMTTDRTGCTLGEAVSSASTTLEFEKGQLGNSNCNYTIAFNGTSSASPTTAGAVALMLEANPSLSWR
ncbi:MAG TPA: S8 family serine peptidase, partial [Bdellovibrio sp.]|nr:S8 family serine peptidase [Bdellovibrio sp.]